MMKRKKFTFIAFLSLTFLIFLAGCKKDFDKIKPVIWKPDFAIPLVKDEITFEDALKESGSEKNFYIDDSGDISFLYYFRDYSFGITPKDLINIPPFPFNYEHQVTSEEQQIISTQDMNLQPVNFSINLTQDFPDARIDKLLVKEGNVVLNMNNTFNNNGHIIIRFLNATKNGVPFIYTTHPFVSGTTSETIDLAGVLFDLSANPSIATIQVECSLKKSNRPVAGDMIRIGFTLNVNTIGRFEGYLGQQTFTPNEAYVKVTAFNNAYILGDLYFVDPMASITIVNSIGIPSRITVRKLQGLNTSSNFSLDITDKLGANAVFPVPSPGITATEPVTKTVDYSNANTGNSIAELFNIKPDRIYYQIKTEINPVKRGINFFTDTSSMYANLVVKLPLYGHFDHLTVQDTFAFSMNKQKEIESVNFKSNITNALPLQAMMQVYFVDKGYHVLDSLTGGDCMIIKEAPVDPATHLPYPGKFGVKDTSFFFNQQRMENLSNAEHILVRAVMNSYDGGSTNVKIRSTQSLRLDFSSEIKYRKTLGK